MAIVCSQMERCPAVFPSIRHISSVHQKQLGHFEMAIFCSPMERRSAFFRSRRHISATIKKELHKFTPPFTSRNVQR